MRSNYAARASSDPDSRTEAPGARLWAVGGGKGGVGKSVVACNLALALARRGERVILVDLDLGGANLHTLLGVNHAPRTLSHFLRRDLASLADAVFPSAFRNLSLVSGAGALIEMANPHHGQKEKLLRHVRALPAEHVLLDLSAGSAFNVLDFFLAADERLAVVIPEPTAIENTYHFLRAAYFRSLRSASREPSVKQALRRALDQRGGSCAPGELLSAVARIAPTAARALERAGRTFGTRLVVNQVRTEAQRALGRDIQATCREHLGAHVEFLGSLPRDECVRDAVRQRRPVLEAHRGCPFSVDLEELALRAVSGSALAAGAAARPDTLARHGAQTPAPPRWRPQPVHGAIAICPLDPASPGAALRRRRERLGLALSELHRRTRLRSLELLENERFDSLPAEPYVRGHVLQYARALGIPDAEGLTARFLDRLRRSRGPADGGARPGS